MKINVNKIYKKLQQKVENKFGKNHNKKEMKVFLCFLYLKNKEKHVKTRTVPIKSE